MLFLKLDNISLVSSASEITAVFRPFYNIPFDTASQSLLEFAKLSEYSQIL